MDENSFKFVEFHSCKNCNKINFIKNWNRISNISRELLNWTKFWSNIFQNLSSISLEILMLQKSFIVSHLKMMIVSNGLFKICSKSCLVFIKKITKIKNFWRELLNTEYNFKQKLLIKIFEVSAFFFTNRLWLIFPSKIDCLIYVKSC